MMDALATAASQAAKDSQAPLSIALSNSANAAMQGAEATKAMLAVYGRAKNIGERARGHYDPGAVSMALIMQFMAEYVRQYLPEE